MAPCQRNLPAKLGSINIQYKPQLEGKSALGQAYASAMAVAEGTSKDCQQPTATPDRTNERTRQLHSQSASLWLLGQRCSSLLNCYSAKGKIRWLMSSHVMSGCQHCQNSNRPKLVYSYRASVSLAACSCKRQTN